MADIPAIKNPPDSLIDEQGRVMFGNFAGPVHEINWQNFDFLNLKRFPWTLRSTWAQKLLKRWQFVGIIDSNFALGAATAHVNYLGTGFVYVYDRANQTLIEFNFKRPLATQTQFSASPDNGITRIEKGPDFLEFDNTASSASRCRLNVSISKTLKAQFELYGDAVGISTACPQDVNGFHYTYKCAGLKARGNFELNGEKHEFGPEAMALYDWTASTPPRITRWNWAAAVGMDAAGRNVGINLSRGLVTDGYSQNSVWIEGRPHLLSQADFEYDPQNIIGSDWLVSTSDNHLDLRFKAQSERRENINLGLVVSRFRQPFGEFSGIIRLPGETLEVKLFGVCEEHLAKW